MKKLFKYEINESVAAKAAMNCVHKRLFKELYALGSPMPQEEVTRGDYDPYEWEYDDYGNEDKRHLILQALVQAGLIQSEKEGWQLNNKIQQILDKTDFSVSNAQDAMKFVKAYGQQIVGESQEQEEDYDFEDPQSPASREEHAMMQKVTQCMAEVLEERGIDVGGKLDEIYFIISDIIERTGNVPQFVEDGGYYPWCEEYVFDVEDLIMRKQEQEELTVEQEEDGINKGGMHNLVQVGHIMNTPSLEEDYDEDDYDDIWMIINLMRKKGMLRAQGIEGRDDVDDGHAINKAYDLIEQKLNDEGMWIDEDVNEAKRFVSLYGDEIATEAMKSALHNQEQEEMEVTDAKHAITQLAAELLHYDDGDLDEVYYAISDIIDSEEYCPEPDEYDEWIEEHVDEIQSLVM